ncbi:uncharacterized protein K452DRAFT_322686 [Aplosporella prunicola CBS 121167]|uniref:Uncharacterized protein n=1 Tax=Aplosporella prunicola CBS 121167 TaxID=1176127 RepID=A0A6A6AVR5_9PEZI|nr:uncharacterized protein K452DRAFT_322686 [Aplosporella prunicola CBS 121167]KAF2136039.1 hypothetical protein K452DRAFT_322686 [Aplosporella prunicola CBS 121167]
MAAPTPPSSSPLFRTPESAASKAAQPLPRPSLPLSPSSPGDDFDPAKPQSVSISKLVGIFKEIRQGLWKHPSPGWAKYRVSVEAYLELLQRIANDRDDSFVGWFNDKARYDYNSAKEELILRIAPTPLHDCFCAFVVKRIEDKLAALTAQHPVELGPALVGVRPCSTARVRFDASDTDTDTDELNPDADPFTSPSPASSPTSSPDQKSPDNQFQHNLAHWPSIVFKVAYSQKAEDLPKVADDYICLTGGNISAVVGLKVDYTPPREKAQARGIKALKPPSKQGHVIMWRLQEFTETSNGEEIPYKEVTAVTEEIFRTATGRCIPGTLSLPLTDFLPPVVLDVYPQARALTETTTVDITHAELCAELADAEARDRVRARGNGLKADADPLIRKRKPEEVDGREKRKNVRVERADKPYRGRA